MESSSPRSLFLSQFVLFPSLTYSLAFTFVVVVVVVLIWIHDDFIYSHL